LGERDNLIVCGKPRVYDFIGVEKREHGTAVLLIPNDDPAVFGRGNQPLTALIKGNAADVVKMTLQVLGRSVIIPKRPKSYISIFQTDCKDLPYWIESQANDISVERMQIFRLLPRQRPHAYKAIGCHCDVAEIIRHCIRNGFNAPGFVCSSLREGIGMPFHNLQRMPFICV
jgi:hypothetical protein